MIVFGAPLYANADVYVKLDYIYKKVYIDHVYICI